jgi:ABC-type transport system substrate-binding protein
MLEEPALDPQLALSIEAFELFRCCLLRTLLSYVGKPTAEGGAVLRPDLAQRMPSISTDGLTWTFHLKAGIRYAPPFEEREVEAADFIRALERFGRLNRFFAGFYRDIEGFPEFAEGKANSIAGLEAGDPRTLVVHLTRPAGDLGNRLALPFAAPIPPRAASGHDNEYGRFLVASGPYMLAGSEQLDFSRPPAAQEAVPGYLPGKQIVLIRNPSWNRQTDLLRPANVDRIEVTIGGSPSRLAREVERGGLDLVDVDPPPDEVRRYRRTPGLREGVFLNPSDSIHWIVLNVAAPPFDDVHVRKAANLAVDKGRLLGLPGTPLADFAGHIILDSLLNNLLLDYDPYATPGHRGDVRKAKAEMARSKYDRNGDGLCDDRRCKNVILVVEDPENRLGRVAEGPFPEQAAVIAQNLKRIGITLDLKIGPSHLARFFIPAERIPIAHGLAWGKDYPSATNFVLPLFYGPSIAEKDNTAASLVGATAKQLEQWGYSVRAVPSVDAKIDECLALVGGAHFECWAEADQLLMERVVPVVPLFVGLTARTVSARVRNFKFDQSVTMPALDQIALRDGSG